MSKCSVKIEMTAEGDGIPAEIFVKSVEDNLRLLGQISWLSTGKRVPTTEWMISSPLVIDSGNTMMFSIVHESQLEENTDGKTL